MAIAVIDVNGNPRRVPIRSEGQLAMRCTAGVLSVAAVLVASRLWFAAAWGSLRLAYRIQIGLFVQKSSVIAASHIK